MASYIRRLLLPTPPGRPPPPIIPKVDGHPLKKPILYRWEIAVIVVGFVLFISFVIMVLARYIRRRNSSDDDSRSRNLDDNPPILFDTQVEDFIDEEQGPQLDHPIWYIRTVGLDRSVIEAITVLKYKAGEGLIEGTECSVCLVEFGEDESLRLLPKCSHAFHVPCIDTWLQSHTNCPLCRAPVVRAIGPEQHSTEIPTPVGSSSNGPIVQENFPDGGIIEVNSNLSFSRVGDAVDDENGIDDNNFGSSRIEDAGKVRSLLGPMKHKLGVASDLGDRSRMVAEKIERKRRSCSMDSHTPAEIYHGVGTATCNRVGASSKQQALEMNSIPSINNARPGGSGNSSFYRLAKSCSARVTLPMKPASSHCHRMEMVGSSSNDHQTLQRHDQHYHQSL